LQGVWLTCQSSLRPGYASKCHRASPSAAPTAAPDHDKDSTTFRRALIPLVIMRLGSCLRLTTGGTFEHYAREPNLSAGIYRSRIFVRIACQFSPFSGGRYLEAQPWTK
jgi:hypothetical protein